MSTNVPPLRDSSLDVFSRLVGQTMGLTSSLSRLAVAEVRDSAGSLLKGIVAIVMGMFVGLIGMLFLLHAAVAFLVQRGWTEASAYLAVGGGGIVLGLVVALVGALMLRGASPVPHRTIREVRTLFGHEGGFE